MADRPLILTGPEVRAILEERKSQHRVPVDPQPNLGPDGQMVCLGGSDWGQLDSDLSGSWTCPFGQPGDRLHVLEEWAIPGWSDVEPRDIPEKEFGSVIFYREKNNRFYLGPWRSPDSMPAWATRIWLEVTAVRAERVQEISQDDVLAEGLTRCRDIVPSLVSLGFKQAFRGENQEDRIKAKTDEWLSEYRGAKDAFRGYWDARHPSHPFDSNPWVWVVEFKRADPPTP